MDARLVLIAGLLVLLSIAGSSRGATQEQQVDPDFVALADSVQDFMVTLRKEVKIVDDVPAGGVTGRGKKFNKIAFPLLIGIKFIAMVMSFIMAVKGLALKALLISKLGLLTTLIVGMKHVYDKMHQPLYDVTPYHSSYQPQQWSTPMWSGGWNEVASGSELSQATLDQAPQGYAVSGSELAHMSPEDVAASNLQAHVAAVYQPNYAAPKAAERKTQNIVPVKYKTTVFKTTVKKYEQ